MLLSRIKKIQAGRLIAFEDASPHTVFQGIPIYVENPKGSVRRWETEEGETGKTKMFHPYGYIKRTEGTDGDEIDCFLGDDKDSDRVYIVAHMIDGKYDEDKVMLGFPSKEHARDAFLAHYTDASHLGPIVEMSMEEFKGRLKNHEDGKRITQDADFDLYSGNKKTRKRIQLTNSSPNEWVWEDIDWGDKSVVYSSRGTAEQMQRQGRIEWKDDSGGKRLAKDADFKEEQHPRDNDGKFSSGGSSSAKSPQGEERTQRKESS